MANLITTPIINGPSGSQLCIIFQYGDIKFNNELPSFTIQSDSIKKDKDLAFAVNAIYAIDRSEKRQLVIIDRVIGLEYINDGFVWKIVFFGFIENTEKFLGEAIYCVKTRKGKLLFRRPLKTEEQHKYN